MSIKSKFFTLITLSVSVAAFGTYAAAQDTAADSQQVQKKHEGKGYGHRGGKGMRGKGNPMRELRGIDLTDAQKAQVKTILDSNRPDDSNREEVRTLMQAKRDGTITPDQQEKLKSFKDQQKSKSDLIKQQIDAILTPEQRQQLETRKAERRSKMKEHRQKRGNRTPEDKPKDN